MQEWGGFGKELLMLFCIFLLILVSRLFTTGLLRLLLKKLFKGKVDLHKVLLNGVVFVYRRES